MSRFILKAVNSKVDSNNFGLLGRRCYFIISSGQLEGQSFNENNFTDTKLFSYNNSSGASTTATAVREAARLRRTSNSSVATAAAIASAVREATAVTAET